MILGVFWSSWRFWGILVIFYVSGLFWGFQGYFGHFRGFRDFFIFFILKFFGLFWSFYVFWSIYRFQNSKFQILLCINGSKQEILKSINFESRHFKSIDLKSKSKSKYPNATLLKTSPKSQCKINQIVYMYILAYNPCNAHKKTLYKYIMCI